MGGPFLLYSGCNNRRVFDERDLKWIQDLVCVACGLRSDCAKAPCGHMFRRGLWLCRLVQPQS